MKRLDPLTDAETLSASDSAFRVLRRFDADGATLCARWNAAISDLRAYPDLWDAIGEERGCEVLRLHERVIAATTIEDKRATIRAFLGYLEAMS